MIRSAPEDKWILHTMSIETFDYNTKAWIRKAISKGMRRHQNAKYFNCSKIRYLRSNCRQGIPRNNVSPRDGKIRRSQSPGLCR